MALTQVTLWSWLTTQEATNQIYCPPDLQVTNEEFAAELASQVKANRLPAEVELFEVNWADTGAKQPRILVQHTSGDPVADMIQFLVGVDQMGNFTYVEEKVCLRPPTLPDVPRERKPSGTLAGILLLASISLFLFTGVAPISAIAWAIDEPVGLLICGVPAAIAFLIGLASAKGYKSAQKAWQETVEWNKQADREQRAWDEAVNSWYKDTLKAAQLARTDDVFGRFTLALTSTVKQVIKTLFEDRQAELRERTEKERTQKEIEEELERRKQEGFR